MYQYIALLRGVNVGGNNKISMSALKAAFKETGFENVSTYINSGNIIFLSDSNDTMALQQKCQQIIIDSFQMDITTSVISAKDLTSALNHAPAWWDEDKESKHNAIFVIEPMSALSVMEAVGEAKLEYEKVSYYGQVIFWSAPIKTFSRTRWSKVVSTKAVYNSITIRNANTVKKLLQLIKGE